MIKRIKLTNWKSHGETEMTFSNGVNALIGIMGSGKNSVMDAISFALYGTFPSLQSRRLLTDDIIMKRPQKRRQAAVELDFVADKSTYFIKRVITEGKGSQAEIRMNGDMLEVNPKGVTAVVEKALQMDYDLFSKAVYSEQNGLDNFLRIPKGQRMQHIDRMLKVDRFDTGREGAVSVINRLKQGREDKMKLLQEMESEGLAEKVNEVSKEIIGIKATLDDLAKRSEDAKKGIEQTSETIEKMEAIEKQLNDSKSLLEGIRGAKETVSKNIEKKITQGKETDLKRIGLELRDMHKKAKEIRESSESMKKQFYENETQVKIINENLDRLMAAGAACPTCDSEITEEKRMDLTDKRRKEILQLDNNRAELKKTTDEQTRLLEELETKIKEKDIEKDRIETIIKEIKELEGRIKELGLKEKEQLVKIAELEKVFEGVEFSKVREELQEKLSAEREMAVQIAALNDKLRDRDSRLNELNKRKSLMDNYKKELEKDGEIMSDLDSFVKALKTTQVQLRNEFLKTVNYIMDKIWPDLYPYDDFTGIRMVMDKDYILQLKETSGWVNVEGTASGGERSLAILALRIAFSMAFIPNLKWLILDEPTHNMDYNAIQHFSDILRDKIHHFAEQVFLITHEERISDGVTGSLYRLERDKSIMGPTKLKAG